LNTEYRTLEDERERRGIPADLRPGLGAIPGTDRKRETAPVQTQSTASSAFPRTTRGFAGGRDFAQPDRASWLCDRSCRSGAIGVDICVGAVPRARLRAPRDGNDAQRDKFWQQGPLLGLSPWHMDGWIQPRQVVARDQGEHRLRPTGRGGTQSRPDAMVAERA